MPERDTDRLRLSDAERDEAARLLGEHYAAGRLTAQEHDERTEAAYAARTRADLPPLFVDLPGAAPWSQPLPDAARVASNSSASGGRQAWRGARPRRGMPVPLGLLVAVAVAVFVVTHLPFLLLALVVWWLVAASVVSRRSGRPHAWACHGPAAARLR